MRRQERIGWVGVLLLAAAVRLVPIASSLPYLGYVDEGHVLHPVITLLRTRGLDPQTYLHPTLTVYLITLSVHAFRPVYSRLIHGHSLFFDLPARDEVFYDLVSPPEIILIGRILIALLGTATVAVAGALARRLGGPAAGLVAGLFVALCPALVSRGSIVIVDTTAAFCAAAALLFAQQIDSEPADTGGALSRAALLGGVCSGLALTAKYTIATVLAAVLVSIAQRPLAWRPKLRLALLAGAGFVGAAVVTMPPLVTRARTVLGGLLQQSRFYSDPGSFDPHNTDKSYLVQLVSPRECGPALVAAALIGAGWMLGRRATRRTAASWLAFAALLITPLLLHPYRPFRQVLALVPPICIASALPLAGAVRTRRYAAVAAVGVLVVASSLAIPAAHVVRERLDTVDTRRIAVDWLSAQTRPSATILIERELAFLPAELRRLGRTVRLASWTEIPALVATERFDYLLAGPVDLFGSRDRESVASVERWNQWLSARKPDASTGYAPTPVYPGFWRSNHEIIRAFRTPGG